LAVFTASMRFDLGEDVEALQEMVHRWAQERVKPMAAKIDRDNVFPHELWREMGDLGLLGITVEEEYGGARHGLPRACDRGRGDRAGLGLGEPELRGAFEPLREPDQAERHARAAAKYLPKLVSGEHVGALAMSEAVRGLGRGGDEPARGEEERPLRAERLEVLDHQRAGRRHAGGLRQDRPRGGLARDHRVPDREGDDRVHDLAAFRQAGDARVEHRRVDLRGLRGAVRQRARRARRAACGC
jgi:hypothetical protein